MTQRITLADYQLDPIPVLTPNQVQPAPPTELRPDEDATCGISVAGLEVSPNRTHGTVPTDLLSVTRDHSDDVPTDRSEISATPILANATPIPSVEVDHNQTGGDSKPTLTFQQSSDIFQGDSRDLQTPDHLKAPFIPWKLEGSPENTDGSTDSPDREYNTVQEESYLKLLADYSPSQIGSALKARRRYLGLGRRDISFDYGWVELLESGDWEGMPYIPFLARYLDVVLWKPRNLRSILIHEPDSDS